MPRYIAIELNSGFIWGDEKASHVMKAVHLIDERINNLANHYENHGCIPPETVFSRDICMGYFMYTVPDDFPDNYIGEDQIVLDLADKRGTYVCFIEPTFDVE